MRNHVRFLSALLWCVGLVLAWSRAESTKPRMSPFDIEFDTVSSVSATGEVKVRLTIMTVDGPGQAGMTIRPVGNILVGRPLQDSMDFTKNGKYVSEFMVTIPPNDTVGMELKVGAGHWPSGALYFVTTSNPTKVFKCHPKFDPPQPPIESWFPGNFDTRQELRTNEQPYVRRPVDTTMLTISVFDSSLARLRESQERRRRDSILEAIKKKPLPFGHKRIPRDNPPTMLDSTKLKKPQGSLIPGPKLVDSIYVLDPTKASPDLVTVFSDDFSGSTLGSW